MGDSRYTLYFEGWTADCEIGHCPAQRNERTKRAAERAIRQHIKRDHPERWRLKKDDEAHLREADAGGPV